MGWDGSEAPQSSEFLSLLSISEFLGFQWQNLTEILNIYALFNRESGNVAITLVFLSRMSHLRAFLSRMS